MGETNLEKRLDRFFIGLLSGLFLIFTSDPVLADHLGFEEDNEGEDTQNTELPPIDISTTTSGDNYKKQFSKLAQMMKKDPAEATEELNKLSKDELAAFVEKLKTTPVDENEDGQISEEETADAQELQQLACETLAEKEDGENYGRLIQRASPTSNSSPASSQAPIDPSELVQSTPSVLQPQNKLPIVNSSSINPSKSITSTASSSSNAPIVAAYNPPNLGGFFNPEMSQPLTPSSTVSQVKSTPVSPLSNDTNTQIAPAIPVAAPNPSLTLPTFPKFLPSIITLPAISFALPSAASNTMDLSSSKVMDASLQAAQPIGEYEAKQIEQPADVDLASSNANTNTNPIAQSNAPEITKVAPEPLPVATVSAETETVPALENESVEEKTESLPSTPKWQGLLDVVRASSLDQNGYNVPEGINTVLKKVEELISPKVEVKPKMTTAKKKTTSLDELISFAGGAK
jgi:hypothetical protein